MQGGSSPRELQVPIEVLADLLKDRRADFRERHLPEPRLREVTCQYEAQLREIDKRRRRNY